MKETYDYYHQTLIQKYGDNLTYEVLNLPYAGMDNIFTVLQAPLYI